MDVIEAANGILKIGAANILLNKPEMLMGTSSGGSNGIFDPNGFSQTVGGIIANTSTGAKSITSAAAAVLTVNNATDYSTGTLVALTGNTLSYAKRGAPWGGDLI